MICDICEGTKFTQRGANHTQCENCGALDTQIGFEEGETCNRDGCEGTMVSRPDPDSGGCACHNGCAPCYHCTSYAPECSKCGERAEQ